MDPYPKDAPPAQASHPWRVTAHVLHPRYEVVTKCFIVGDYRWYWVANAVSFFYHHVLGYGCNTWKMENETASTPPAH